MGRRVSVRDPRNEETREHDRSCAQQGRHGVGTLKHWVNWSVELRTHDAISALQGLLSIQDDLPLSQNPLTYMWAALVYVRGSRPFVESMRTSLRPIRRARKQHNAATDTNGEGQHEGSHSKPPRG